MLKTMWSALI